MHGQDIGETSAGEFEKFFVVFGLLISTGAFMNLATTPGGSLDDASGTPAMQILWAFVDITILMLLYLHCKGFWRALRNEPLLIALIALALASTLWSGSPFLTLRRAIALMSTVLFGTYFGLRYPVSQQLRLIAGACGITMVFSFLFGFLDLGTAVDQQETIGWIGVFVQKNELGRMMLLSTIVFLLLLKTRQVSRILANVGIMLSVILIALSRSMTAAVALGLLLLVFPINRLLRRSTTRAIQTLLALGILGSIAIFWIGEHLDLVTQAIGKDITLTGRLEIWIFSVLFALHKPWLGYGYNAFWINTQESALRVWKLMHWEVPHSHNGLLEIWLELGLVGVGVFLLGFLKYLNKAIHLLSGARKLSAEWAVLFLVFFFISNLTESAFIARHTIFVILYVSVAVTLSKQGQIASGIASAHSSIGAEQ